MSTIKKVTAAAKALLISTTTLEIHSLPGKVITDEMLERHASAQVDGIIALTNYVVGLNFATVRERQAVSIQRLAEQLGFEVVELDASGKYRCTDITTGVGTLRVTRSVVRRTKKGEPVYSDQALLRVMHDESGASLDVAFDVREVADVVEPEVVYDYDPSWSQECPGVAA